MMMFKKSAVDERVRATAWRAASVWLGVTQTLLAVVVLYRLLVLGQAESEIWDMQAVLGISLFGHIALQLYLGGLFPVPTWKGMVVAWLVLVAVVAAVAIPSQGMPSMQEWKTTWLPGFLGPALFVGVYSLVAWLGERRVERLIAE